jgi:hypothetical protein
MEYMKEGLVILFALYLLGALVWRFIGPFCYKRKPIKFQAARK